MVKHLCNPELLDIYPVIPLKPKDHKYLLVIGKLYDQQKQMY